MCLLAVAILSIINPGILNQAFRFVKTSLWEPPVPWTLTIKQNFILCGHSLSLQKTYPTKLAIDAFLKRHENCIPRINTGHIISCQEQVSDFCPTCRDKQFLGVRDQEVVVIRGTPGRPGPIKERTLIKIKFLPNAEIADLKSGIAFRDEKEKLQLLEGLNGLVSN